MADVPYTGVDPIVSKINKMLNDATLKVLVPLIEGDIVAAVPWMGFPVIKQIWQFPFEYAIAKAYEAGYVWISNKWTEAQVKGQVATTNDARSALAAEMSKPEEEQDDAKIQAELAEFDRRWNELTAFPSAA